MKNFFLILGALSVLLLACEPEEPEPTAVPPVVELMPDLPGYDVVEAQTLQGYIAGLAEGSTLLTGHPELTALVIKVDQALTCYQEIGAVRARIYSDRAFPLSSGAIAIVDRDRLLDPATFARCVGGQIIPFSEQPTLNPCTHNYTLQRDGNEFYVAYVGTTSEICATFCSSLEGCER